MDFTSVKLIFHVVWQCVFPKTKNYGRKNTVLARGKHLSGRIGGGRSLFVLTICLLPALAIMFPWRPMAFASRLWGLASNFPLSVRRAGMNA